MTADEILNANRYMTLATADAAGVPWVSPVWFAFDAAELFWISYTHRRHSRNIAERPEIAVVVFDSTVKAFEAKAVYMSATAALLEDHDRLRALAVYTRREAEQGLGLLTLADLEADGGLRLYRARVTERWILDGNDNRVPA
jgi:uncharacterized protein YhbP (UPF0306 family)